MERVNKRLLLPRSRQSINNNNWGRLRVEPQLDAVGYTAAYVWDPDCSADGAAESGVGLARLAGSNGIALDNAAAVIGVSYGEVGAKEERE